MRTWKILILLTLTILSGCFRKAKIDWTNPAETASRVQTKHDDFQKITNYQGPYIYTIKNRGTDSSLFMRAWTSQKGRSTSYQIYVSDSFELSWRSYSEAYDSDGKKLDLTKIDHNVSCGRYGDCKYREEVALNVSRKYLEDHSTSGMRFQISGTGGKEAFELPGGYIRGFLQSVPK